MLVDGKDMVTGRLVSPPHAGGVVCAECAHPVHAVIPLERSPHWRHNPGYREGCPGSYEPTTEWHLDWQSLAPPESREVWCDGRRADMVTRVGKVYEVQRSSISLDTAVARSRHHRGRTGLEPVWIVHSDHFGRLIVPESIERKRHDAAVKGGGEAPEYTDTWVGFSSWLHELLKAKVTPGKPKSKKLVTILVDMGEEAGDVLWLEGCPCNRMADGSIKHSLRYRPWGRDWVRDKMRRDCALFVPVDEAA